MPLHLWIKVVIHVIAAVAIGSCIVLFASWGRGDLSSMSLREEMRHLAFPGSDDRLDAVVAWLRREDIDRVSELAGEAGLLGDCLFAGLLVCCRFA